MKIRTTNSYEVEFPHGLDDRAEARMTAPYRGETVAIPFVIRGEPGLLNVRFEVRSRADEKRADEKRDGEKLDHYIEIFTSVLRPGGILTNFIGRRTKELRGELTVPRRLFPIEIDADDVTVENLSAPKSATS